LIASYDVVVETVVDNMVRRGPNVKSLLRQAVKRVAQYSIDKEASDDCGDDGCWCYWRGRVPAEVEALIEDKKTRLAAGGGMPVLYWSRLVCVMAHRRFDTPIGRRDTCSCRYSGR
jgi:hypothetical protein